MTYRNVLDYTFFNCLVLVQVVWHLLKIGPVCFFLSYTNRYLKVYLNWVYHCTKYSRAKISWESWQSSFNFLEHGSGFSFYSKPRRRSAIFWKTINYFPRKHELGLHKDESIGKSFKSHFVMMLEKFSFSRVICN